MKQSSATINQLAIGYMLSCVSVEHKQKPTVSAAARVNVMLHVELGTTLVVVCSPPSHVQVPTTASMPYHHAAILQAAKHISSHKSQHPATLRTRKTQPVK